jgi:anti-sigma factor ChrR (cupin superfamily)
MMQLNIDFERVVVTNTVELPWQLLYEEGVAQRLLEKVGTKLPRTTSIIRYLAGASIPSHAYGQGEEMIVLEGEYSDEFGVYPAGTYIKNPTGTQRTSITKIGCVLFVKQGHLQQDDTERVVIDVQNSPWRQGMVAGLRVMPLSEFKGEHSALVRWQPGTVFNAHRHWGGEEIYVLEGIFEDEFGRYPKGTWLRNPHMSQHAPFSQEGCTIFVKVGHLPEVNKQ